MAKRIDIKDLNIYYGSFHAVADVGREHEPVPLEQPRAHLVLVSIDCLAPREAAVPRLVNLGTIGESGADSLDGAFQTAPDSLVIPSYALRRGHPFYIPRRLWGELLALGADATLRTLVLQHNDAIRYVNVDTDAILRDMDTPADFAEMKHEA